MIPKDEESANKTDLIITEKVKRGENHLDLRQHFFRRRTPPDLETAVISELLKIIVRHLMMNGENYRLKKMAHLVKGKRRVLDIGWVQLPNLFLSNHEVVGLDVEKREMLPNYTSSYRGDVMNLPEPFGPGAFDAVVAGEIIEHLERPLDFLRSCHQLLSLNGIIVLSTPNPNSPIERLLTLNLSRNFFYTQDHVVLFPQRWLIRMMEIAGFSDVKLYSAGIPIPFFGLLPFPRPWCYQTIAVAQRRPDAL
ncbi:MAG: hypothetical protein B6245_01935 [Desulfobacteraceae bacterium 4572_88]|nr:MAG: hypothetical protein B6245_01935 [Desulfobacteraceae bacterium 4572_88]